MEKKEKFFSSSNCDEEQCITGFSSFKSLSNLSQSLVGNIIIYNLNNINIPKWKDLTKAQKVTLFFNYIVDDSWRAITLRFSDRFMMRCNNNPKISDFIRRRINENFKNRLGYVPEYLFTLEFDNRIFHIHGAIKHDNNIELIKKILKATAFSKKCTHNSYPEQFKLCCKSIHNARGWGQYILKYKNRRNFDIYICTPIIRRIAKKHRELFAKQEKFNKHF